MTLLLERIERYDTHFGQKHRPGSNLETLQAALDRLPERTRHKWLLVSPQGDVYAGLDPTDLAFEAAPLSSLYFGEKQ